MLKKLTNCITEEMTKDSFIKELENFREVFTCVDIIGSINKLHQFENFDFYTFESERTFEEFIALGDADEEDNDLRICLDCVDSYIKDSISGNLILTLDNGLIVQIFQS